MINTVKTKELKTNKTILSNMTHNTFFKNCITDKVIAKEFFEQYLPKEVLEIVELSSLKLEKSDFQEQILNEDTTGVLFSVSMKKSLSYLYVFFRGEIPPNKHFTLKVMSCFLEVYRQHVSKYKVSLLPIVYPMVIYAGEEECKCQNLSLLEILQESESIKEYFIDSIKDILPHLKDQEIVF